jgi:hypothetical protein
VFAERRPSWSHQQAAFPGAAPFEQARAFPNTPMTWTHQYDFRFVEGEPSFYGSPASSPLDAYSKQWIGDHVPRKIDMLSLMSMSDAFFGRVFLARRELIPFGTVSITTYFPHLLGRTRGRGHHAGVGRGGRQDFPQELWRPARRIVVAVGALARDHNANRAISRRSGVGCGKGAFAPCHFYVILIVATRFLRPHSTRKMNGTRAVVETALRAPHLGLTIRRKAGLMSERQRHATKASPCSASPSRSAPRNSEP